MINRVVLMGRLVSDPELRTTESGKAVTTIRVAIDRAYVPKDAERQADFFDVVAWRNTAEFICRNFSKGSLIAIDGHLQSRQYDKDGKTRTVVEVIADSVSFTGERKNEPPEDHQRADRHDSDYRQPDYRGGYENYGYASRLTDEPVEKYDGYRGGGYR